MRIIFACPEGAGKWRILFFAMLLHSKNFKFMLTSRGHSGKIPIAVQTTENGGIAQLARACGSYPQCPRFESRCRYQIKAQPFDCAFLWPVGQVVKTPPFHGGNMGSSPVRVTTPLRTSYCSQRLFLSGQKPLLVFSAAAHFWPIPAFAGIQAGFRVFAKLPCVPCRNSSVITPAAANGVSLAGRVVPLYRPAPRATEARLCMAGFAPVQNNAV